MKALVVFHDHGCHVLDPLLRQGFRHVFCAVESGDSWISIDSRAGVMVVKVVAPSGYDLATFYRGEGFTVVETTQRAVPTRAPFAMANCVGCVKAVLSICSFAVTPWRLYKFLRRHP